VAITWAPGISSSTRTFWAVRAPTFFRLPAERVVELGVQVEI